MKIRISNVAWGMLALFVVMFAGIGALRIREHNREGSYFPPGDRRDRVWQTVPIVVSASASVLTQFQREVGEAIRAINDETKCNLLTARGAPVQVNILSIGDRDPCPGSESEPLPKRAGAASYVCHDGTTDILLSGLEVEPRKVHVLLKHELGHALGLDDDGPNGEDLMAPFLADKTWQDTTKPLPWLSTKDREALANRYPQHCQ